MSIGFSFEALTLAIFGTIYIYIRAGTGPVETGNLPVHVFRNI